LPLAQFAPELALAVGHIVSKLPCALVGHGLKVTQWALQRHPHLGAPRMSWAAYVPAARLANPTLGAPSSPPRGGRQKGACR
jgi:hypothetical protein